MEIKLLKDGYYKNEEIYKDFIKGTISYNQPYFSEESITVSELPDFPIYFAYNYAKIEDFINTIKILKKYMVNTDRDIHLDGKFWHSLLLIEKREYILSKYPQVKESRKAFNKIVLKNFDWENYIYKCMLAAEYINNAKLDIDEEEKYMMLIFENLDLFNYLIKYQIFRNSEFIIKLLKIINEEGLTEKMKEKIKNRPDLGNDERYGRRVIYELNKNYPVVMSPFLEKDELKEEIYNALKIYDEID